MSTATTTMTTLNSPEISDGAMDTATNPPTIPPTVVAISNVNPSLRLVKPSRA
jgi:hypothetical protein